MVDPFCKKIRILSFQNAHNFGAVLQAYGLQQTILSMGYKDVKFLNYNPKYLSDRYNPFARRNIAFPSTLRGSIGWCAYYLPYMMSSISRNRKFNDSIKSMLIQTNKLILDKEGFGDEDADVLICGSDQIWNTALTGDFDPVYLGEGNYRSVGIVASYAPSTELSSLTEAMAERLCAQLSRFKYLSVRENPVKDRLQKYISEKIQVCVDPTILCGAKSYLDVASPRLETRDYIVVYAYDPNDSIIQDLIKTIPEYQNYSIHVILLGPKGLRETFRKNVHSAIKVQDFLSYIKYASYVVTNSFHGLAFSLLFEKNFNVAYCEGKHVRCLSLLQQIEMEERFVRNKNNIHWENLDYKQINQKLENVRKDSLNYLKKVLEG